MGARHHTRAMSSSGESAATGATADPLQAAGDDLVSLLAFAVAAAWHSWSQAQDLLVFVKPNKPATEIAITGILRWTLGRRLASLS